MIDMRLGDCLELLPTLADKSIDLIVCDPPYGSTACKWDSIIPMDKMWQEVARVIKDNGAVVFFADMRFAVELITNATVPFRYDLIWEKNQAVGHLCANKRPLRAHEIILVFYKKQPAYTPQKAYGFKTYDKTIKPKAVGEVYGGAKVLERQVSDGSRHPRSVQKFNNKGKELTTNQFGVSRIHPTQKPVDLLEFLVMSYSKEGDTVLDFTAGSFSTAIACMNTNRNFVGFEMDSTYFAKGKERIENHTPCQPSPRHKDDL